MSNINKFGGVGGGVSDDVDYEVDGNVLRLTRQGDAYDAHDKRIVRLLQPNHPDDACSKRYADDRLWQTNKDLQQYAKEYFVSKTDGEKLSVSIKGTRDSLMRNLRELGEETSALKKRLYDLSLYVATLATRTSKIEFKLERKFSGGDDGGGGGGGGGRT